MNVDASRRLRNAHDHLMNEIASEPVQPPVRLKAKAPGRVPQRKQPNRWLMRAVALAILAAGVGVALRDWGGKSKDESRHCDTSNAM